MTFGETEQTRHECIHNTVRATFAMYKICLVLSGEYVQNIFVRPTGMGFG